jgi:hypothetical protein
VELRALQQLEDALLEHVELERGLGGHDGGLVELQAVLREPRRGQQRVVPVEDDGRLCGKGEASEREGERMGAKCENSGGDFPVFHVGRRIERGVRRARGTPGRARYIVEIPHAGRWARCSALARVRRV